MKFENEINKAGFSEEELNDVNECISNLLSTIAGEQGLDRDFGIDISDITDMTTEEVERYEPRVEVDDIEFVHDNEGRVMPIIYFKKREMEDEED